MAPSARRLLIPALFFAGIVALGWLGARYGLQGSAEPSAASLPEMAPPLEPGQRVTFLELGSVGCKPCEDMKPVMQAVQERYGEWVEVVFHDVKNNGSIARKYGIRLIPTQVFLRADGTEFFRHEGYFGLQEVERVLAQMGVR